MLMRCLVVNKYIRNLKKRIKEENLVYSYSVLIVTMFASAICYNLFLRPLKIVAGGTNGLSIIVEKVFSIEPSFFILIFSIVVLVLAYFAVGAKKASSALVATFVYPLFVDATSFLTYFINVSNDDIIIASVFAGIISGWVSGFTCKVELSQGGITLINQILYEKFNISISKSNFVINMFIIIAGGFYFGITTVLCAIILLYVSSTLIDKVMLGVSNNKTFYIMTEKETEVRKYIVEQLKSGVTIFNVKSGKENDNRSVIMVVIPNYLYHKATKRIKLIDGKAFFIVTDSYQVVGGHNN